MSHSPLPESWVCRIFDHLSALYGKRFADMWDGVEPAAMRASWANKLGGFADKPKAIKQALDSLDSKPFPPTLPEFLTMCREAASRGLDDKPALPHYPSAEEIARAEEAAKKLRETVLAMPKRDPLQWAKDLQQREVSGESLHHLQAKMWREALGVKDGA